jgi:autotransporter-associated beta strand protein
LTGFSGTISCGTSSGSFRFNNATNANNCKGSPAANFDLGTGSAKLANCGGGGLTYDLGSLAGGASTVLSGSVSNTPTTTSTYSIGANGSNTTFSGTIANGVGAVSVTKVGIGILWLNGNNTYTGPTTVSYGTLGGTGAITGPLTVQSGATLAPGTSIGSFSVGGTVNLNSGGRALMEINRGAAPNSDRVVAPSVVAASGAIITVTNIGTPNLAFQDSFKLLSTPLSGSGYTLNLPALPNSNLYWTNKLGIDGTIEVAAIVNPLPPTIGVSRIGNQLTLSWPPDHRGWTLLTNSVGVTASGSWFPYPSSDTLTNITLTLDPAQTNVFYKLVYPYP